MTRADKRAVGDAQAFHALADGVRELVEAYDRSGDHDPTHNGVLNHDCVRCRLLSALGVADPLRWKRGAW